LSVSFLDLCRGFHHGTTLFFKCDLIISNDQVVDNFWTFALVFVVDDDIGFRWCGEHRKASTDWLRADFQGFDFAGYGVVLKVQRSVLQKFITRAPGLQPTGGKSHAVHIVRPGYTHCCSA